MFYMNNQSVIYQASSLTFDPSLIELFCAIYTGATLFVLPTVYKLMPQRLGYFLRKHNVTHLQVLKILKTK